VRKHDERLGWRDCGKACKIQQIKRPLPPFATLRRGKVEKYPVCQMPKQELQSHGYDKP